MKKNHILLPLLACCAMLMSGCLFHSKIGSGHFETGKLVETRQIDQSKGSDHRITVTPSEGGIGISVTSYVVDYHQIADHHEKIKAQEYQGCGFLDYFPLIWLVKIISLDSPLHCDEGEYYTEKTVLPGEFNLKNKRNVEKARSVVESQGTVKVLVNGKEVDTLKVQGISPELKALPLSYLYAMWPLTNNDLCFAYEGARKCTTVTGSQAYAMIKENSGYQKYKEQLYDKCVEKNDVFSCQWAGTLYSISEPGNRRIVNSFFRSCANSPTDLGCDNAAKFGAEKEVAELLQKRKDLAQAEQQRKEKEAQVKRKEEELREEQARQRREREEKRAKQRALQERLDSQEMQRTIVDAVKNATDEINRNTERNNQMMRQLYGY